MERLTQEEFWAKIPHWVVVHPDLDPSAIRVYAVLSKRANNNTRNTFPGIRLIAADGHMSKTTVMKALAVLESVGAVEILRDKTGNRHKVNRYHLPMNRVPKSDPPPGTESGTGGSISGTSDGSISGTELDGSKNQRIREDDFSIPKQEPGEPLAAYLARIHSLMNPP